MLSINQKCVCGLSTLICLWTEIQKGNSSRKKAERLWREWDRIYTPYQFTNNNLEKNSLLKDIYTHMYMHIFVCTCIYTHIHMIMCVYTCVCMCVCVCVSCSVISDSLLSHGPYTARLLCPWNSLGKNTGVSSHSLL